MVGANSSPDIEYENETKIGDLLAPVLGWRLREEGAEWPANWNESLLIAIFAQLGRREIPELSLAMIKNVWSLAQDMMEDLNEQILDLKHKTSN
jgi:hypothetical protein